MTGVQKEFLDSSDSLLGNFAVRDNIRCFTRCGLLVAFHGCVTSFKGCLCLWKKMSTQRSHLIHGTPAKIYPPSVSLKPYRFVGIIEVETKLIA